ncbi:MAG: exopolyphosphatase [Deltaproteobacteria bacterium]|nr:exopolyphosphatase [Deltaproteobacteria bacterium]
MRLVTRPDFDGIVSGALITAVEDIDAYLFVEPKFMQDGAVDIRPGDIIANLPYHPACTLWFDHHFTNGAAGFDRPVVPGRGAFRLAPSAARVVFEYYSEVPSASEARYRPGFELMHTDRFTALLEDTDKIDGGYLTREDVLQPAGYVLISMTIYGKDGAEEHYWRRLIELIRDRTLQEVLDDPEVQRRCARVLGLQERLRRQLLEHAELRGNVIFLDLRDADDLTDANRFLLYTLFPEGNISMKVSRDAQRAGTTAISVGYNIFNTTSTVNVGDLLSHYGGGGHRVVGSCRVPEADAERSMDAILRHITEAET